MWLIAIFVSLGLIPPAYAAEAAPSLSALVAEALQQNPTLRAARARVEAARAMPAQLSAYDDPMFSYEAYNAPDPFRVDRADNNIFRVSQRIPFPGKRRLAGAVAEHDAEVMHRDLAGLEQDVAAAVKRAYCDLWLAHAKVSLFEREHTLGQRFSRLTQQRYTTGEVSQSDVLRSQVELTRLITRIHTQRLALEVAAAELNGLLSREADQPLATPEVPEVPELPQPAEYWIERALHQRPELEAQREMIAREDTNIDLAHKKYMPDFELTFGRFVNPDAPDGVGAIASVTIPLLYRSKYDAGLAEAKARRTAADGDRRALQDRIRREVKQALLRVQSLRRQRDLFVTTHLPQTEQSLRVAENGYQAGIVDFLALTETARTIEEVHLEHLDTEAELGKAYADLQRAVGDPTDDRGGADAHR